MCHLGPGLFSASGLWFQKLEEKEAGSRQLEGATLPLPQRFYRGAASFRLELLRGSWMTLPSFSFPFLKGGPCIKTRMTPIHTTDIWNWVNLCCRWARVGGSTHKNFSDLPCLPAASRPPLLPTMIMKNSTLLLHQTALDQAEYHWLSILVEIGRRKEPCAMVAGTLSWECWQDPKALNSFYLLSQQRCHQEVARKSLWTFTTQCDTKFVHLCFFMLSSSSPILGTQLYGSKYPK